MATKHPFISAKSDGGDATLVLPSDWNSSHLDDDLFLSAAIGGVAGSGYGQGPTGVQSGAAVTAQGAPDQTVAVSAGVARIGGRKVTVAGGNVSLSAANATNPRWDLITVDTSATKAAVDGTAAARPVYPAIPAGRVVLAVVYRAANDNTINTVDITDKRVIIEPPPWENVLWYGADPTGVADSQPAFVLAHDAAPTVGGCVFVPTGAFKLNSTWTISKHAFRVIGEGAVTYGATGASMLISGTNGMTMVTFYMGLLSHNGPHFQNINWVIPSGQTTTTCLYLRQVNRWRVFQCSFNGEDAAGQGTGIDIDADGADNDWGTIISSTFGRLTTCIVFRGVGLYCFGNGFLGTTAFKSGLNNNFDSTHVIGNRFNVAQALVMDGTGGFIHNIWIGNTHEMTNSAGLPNYIEFGKVGAVTQSYGNGFLNTEISGKGQDQDIFVLGPTSRDNYVGPIYSENIGTGTLFTNDVASTGNRFDNMRSSATDPNIRLRQSETSGKNIIIERVAGQGNVMEVQSTAGALHQGWGANNWTVQDTTAPGTPAAGYLVAYVNGDIFTTKNDGGTIVQLGFGGAGYPVDVGTAEADGTATVAARSDHAHAHGVIASGDHHTEYRRESVDLRDVTFAISGTLATGTGALRWYNDLGSSITLQSVRASVGTQPTGASLIVDVNNNGTTVYGTQGNRPTIAVSTNTAEGGAMSDTTVADGEYITVDIDQVGSSVAGADLTVTVWYTF